MNLAIIGASYLQLPLIKRAKEMGFTTHVFAWKVKDVGESVADYFYPISIVDKEQIAEKCREIRIDAICSIATDLGAFTVNYVANQLGLPGNSMECAYKSTNKYRMRLAFESQGDPSPKSILVDSGTNLRNLDIPFPVIVKPTDRSGSRGICKVDDGGDIEKAVSLAIQQSFEGKALVEEFITGHEYSVEGISYNGEHHILAITKKLTTGAPNYIEIGHIEPALMHESTLRRVEKVVTHALDTLEISNSASHSEIKIDDDGTVTIVEIGGRMGGDCIGSHLVRYSTGIDYIRATIQVACGNKPDLVQLEEGIPVEIRYIISEDDLRDMDKAKKDGRFIELIDYHPELFGNVKSSADRAGCYLVSHCPPTITNYGSVPKPVGEDYAATDFLPGE